MEKLYGVLRDVPVTLAEEYKLWDLINHIDKENIATQNEALNKQQKKVHDMTVLINSDQMGRTSRKIYVNV
jgi:hypothetical protein